MKLDCSENEIAESLPLGSGIAFTFNSNHVNPQQSVKRFQCNSSHFGILVLKQTNNKTHKYTAIFKHFPSKLFKIFNLFTRYRTNAKEQATYILPLDLYTSERLSKKYFLQTTVFQEFYHKDLVLTGTVGIIMFNLFS